MNSVEHAMLEELKKHLKSKLHKDAVEGYQKNPGSLAIVAAALKKLKEAINETPQP